MTDVPSGGGDPDGSVDDDALAAALAAEVAAYTKPITVPGASRRPESVDPADPDPASPSSSPPALDLGEVSTLEAIERLERELRRRAAESQPVAVVAGPPAESGPAASPPAEAPPAEAPPAGDLPADRIFPSPYRPFAPAPEALAQDASPQRSASPVSEPEPEVDPGTTRAPYVLDDGAPGPAFPPPTLVEPEPTPPRPFPMAPPTGEPIDLSQLPPPVGLQPAPLPPYTPTGPTPTFDFPPPVGAPIPVDAATPAAAVGGADSAPGPLSPPVTGDFEALLGLRPPTAESAAPRVDLDSEDDDDVDDVDRAFRPALPVDATGSAAAVEPPSQPIATARLGDDEPALGTEMLETHPAFEVESAGSEPTALDLRAGRAARLFWLWFAANSSILSLAVGATLFQFGMSLRQAIVATLAGVAISFLPLGLGTLAGKWSGQPTMIVSRATFGVVGNVIPAVLAIVSRVFWGGVLLWLLAAAVGRVLVEAGLDAGLGETIWTLAGMVAGFAIATVVAVFGYGFIARLQLVLSIVAGALIVGAAVLTFPRLDISRALTVGDGPWILVAGGAVLVFSFLGLAWVHSSADVARYQRTGSSGGSSMLWATFGATLPAFLLIGWGAMLAASDPELAAGLAAAPLSTLAGLLPAWYPAPLLLAAGLGLLSGVVLTLYSAGFALQSVGMRVRRSVTTAIAAVLVLAAAAALTFLAPDAGAILRDAATTLAVPVAAWAGIFAAEMMVRSQRFSSDALLARGGIYPDVRWLNLVGLVLISAIGFGFTTATLPGLDWQGFLLPLLGIGLADPIAISDLGVFVALLLGLLLPLVAGIPAIRRQEEAGDRR